MILSYFEHMSNRIHLILVVLLLLIGASVTYQVAAFGWDYYTADEAARPYHPNYDLLKPTGLYGHGYGIVGSAMIIIGVIMYSSRKRIQLLSGLGRIKHYLDIHIVLCLLGPILVVFHTTFKFGGLVAVCFWSMAAVVASGVIGRYLYVQIPKGIQGNELSVADLEKEKAAIGADLLFRHHLNPDLLRLLDEAATPQTGGTSMSFLSTVHFIVFGAFQRRRGISRVITAMKHEKIPHSALSKLRRAARRRVLLSRRIALLQQFRRVFHYWHVIHLPFAFVMFIILFIHVGVAVAFGYTWVF